MGILSQIYCSFEMPAPSNRIPVRPARGERAVLENSLDSIQEGEIIFARDEDALYVKDNGFLVNVAQGTGIGEQIVSAEIVWDVALLDDGYGFDGPGLTSSVKNPTIYVIRGGRYKFRHALTSDPLQVTTTSGAQYDEGIANNPVDNGLLAWTVSMQAPQKLKYKSTETPSREGDIIVISDTFSLGLQELDDVSDVAATDGQVLAYSDALSEWVPSDLAAGGATNLNSLTDVVAPTPVQDDVLKYNGQFWEALPEAADPGNAGRKSSASVLDARGVMAGTEFILSGQAEWEALGFTVFSGYSGYGEGDFFTTEIGYLDNWAPIGRTDSSSRNDQIHFDGSGRVFGFTNFPEDYPSLASTKNLSFPQNGSFGMTAFLSNTFTIFRVGLLRNHSFQDLSWDILRIEYDNGFGGQMPVEYWFNSNGSFKMCYGVSSGGFTFDADVNKNGFTFNARTDDATLGDINQNLPGLTGSGDYVIEIWYNGTGYNLDDLANVDDSGTTPPRDGFPLVWNAGSWGAGSIVQVGSQASTSGGDVGQFAIDDSYLYIAVGLNQWKRIPLETFV